MALNHRRWRTRMRFPLFWGLLFVVTAVQASPPRFTEFDFQEFLESHPLVRQFDPATHRFLGTPSEFRSPKDLERQLEQIRAEARQTHQEEAALLSTSVASPGKTDDEFWQSQKRLQERMDTLTRRLASIQAQLALGGKTDHLAIVPQILGIMSDLAAAGPGSGSVRLNRLPRLTADRPDFGAPNPWLLFQWTKDPSLLYPYLRQSYVVGMLFRHSTAPILYSHPRQE